MKITLIYGPQGTGKTTLVKQMAKEVLEKFPVSDVQFPFGSPTNYTTYERCRPTVKLLVFDPINIEFLPSLRALAKWKHLTITKGRKSYDITPHIVVTTQEQINPEEFEGIECIKTEYKKNYEAA